MDDVTLTYSGSKVLSSFDDKTYLVQSETEYKRFMFRFSGNAQTASTHRFQLEGIKINDKDTFTLVTGYINGTLFSDGAYVNFIDGNTATKWGATNCTSGAVIFDSSSAFVPSSYSLQIGNDTNNNKDRNPKWRYLYASTGTPTTTGDASWTLLARNVDLLPTTNYYWTTLTATNNLLK